MAYKLPKSIQFQLIRGDRKDMSVAVGQDLTNKTVVFTAKIQENVYPFDGTDATAVIKKTAVIDDAENGRCHFEFMHADTRTVVPGEYFADIQIIDAGEPISTNIFKIEILPDVGQAV